MASPAPSTIRVACLDDIEALDRYLPSTDIHGGHSERLRSQDAGESSYWIAILNDMPIGHVMVRWSGFRFGALPHRFSGIPVLLKLRVWPSKYWGRGIGSALVTYAENAAAKRGYPGIGLGVEIDNERAVHLYERLGYIDWGGGSLCEDVKRIDADGREVLYGEVFTVMTKQFSA